MAEDRTDAALWSALLAGDVDAFDVLYDRHATAVHRFLSRRVGAQSAEDLTAAVFAEAWAQRGRVEVGNDRGLGPWLMGIAANMARRHHARQAAGQRAVDRWVGASVTQPDHADDVAAAIDDVDDLRRARAALAGLPDCDQEVLILCVLEGRTPADVALILGQRASTVRSRLTRARRRLAAAFDASVHPRPVGR